MIKAFEKSRFLTVVLLVIWVVLLPGQEKRFEPPPVLFEEPLSPRIANYDMVVTLNPNDNTLQGKQILTWKNTSGREITELQFHLYLNAFRNSQSTFMLERGRRFRGLRNTLEGWGFIDVNRMVLLPSPARESGESRIHDLAARAPRNLPGRDVSARLEFIQPDIPEHKQDKTVLRLALPEPLPPGQSLALFMDFTARLPEPPYARTGTLAEFFMVAQWYPKVGVYTEAGWNCHQFHTNSEFFADFGVYNVWITVPEAHIVGATGVQVGAPQLNGDGSATHFYHAEDVHDFAWTTSPEFVEFKGKAQDVDIRVLMQPDHLAQGARHVEATRVAIEYCQQWYGDYPYPGVTVVDPRRGAGATAGMEYPTLFTGMTFYGLPEGVRLVEMVLFHEFAHNYWQHMIATNEVEESWLDEGLTNYSEIQIMNAQYGGIGNLVDFLGIQLSNHQYQRGQYLLNAPLPDPMLRKSWEYYSNSSYGINSYDKPAILLSTLHNYLGEETMREVMRTYFQRWQFKHPRSRDFLAVMGEVGGPAAATALEQALYTTAVLDYSVDAVFTRPASPETGFDYEFSAAESLRAEDVPESPAETVPEALDSLPDSALADSAAVRLYHSGVNLRRRGDFVFPVELEVVFEDGEAIREQWDGREQWKKFRYLKPSRLVSATVDPDGKLLLDINFTNNSKTLEPSSLGINKLSIRGLFWAQFIMDQPEFLNLFTLFLD